MKRALTLAVFAALVTGATACKKDEKKPSPAQPVSEPKGQLGGNGGGAPPQPVAPGRGNVSSAFQIAPVTKPTSLRELAPGYFELNQVRFHSLDQKIGMQIHLKKGSHPQPGDEVRTFAQKIGRATTTTAQLPTAISSDDKGVGLHDFLMVGCTVEKKGNSITWSWGTSVAALTGNSVLPGTPGLGVSYNYNGKFHKYEIEQSDDTIRLVSTSDEIILELTFTKKNIREDLIARPSADIRILRDGNTESLGIMRGIYIPVSESASNESQALDNDPILGNFVRQARLKAERARKLHNLGLWITGTVAEVSFGNRVEYQSSLAWTSDLMAWKDKLAPMSKAQVLDGLKALRDITEAERQELSRRQDGASWDRLFQGKLTMIDEAVQKLERGESVFGLSFEK